MRAPPRDSDSHRDPLLGRPGDAFAIAWGLAEGLIFFLVPDMFFSLTASRSPLRGLRHVGLVILGSLIAGLVLHTWATRDAAGARGVVIAVPFIDQAMFTRVEADYQRLGAMAPLAGPLSGVPYKVYAVVGAGHTPLLPFLLISVPARAERLLITWAQFAVLGLLLRRWTRRPELWSAVAYAAYWLLVYTWYWSSR